MLDVLIARIARGKWERSEVGTWLAQCYCDALTGRVKIGRLIHELVDAEPTSVARNAAVRVARRESFDVLFMVDADMVPAGGFFMHALRFLKDATGAVIIGSPYCGVPPACDVQVMKPGTFERYTRDEAKALTGNTAVGAIGTGLLAFNVAAFDKLSPPYFDYEYPDERRETVSRTEDVSFTRRLTEAGGRVFAAWDEWSGHAKEAIVGKPG